MPSMAEVDRPNCTGVHFLKQRTTAMILEWVVQPQGNGLQQASTAQSVCTQLPLTIAV